MGLPYVWTSRLRVVARNRIDTGHFHQVGARFATVSVVTSVNVPSMFLDYKCTFTVALQIRMKSISPPSIGNYTIGVIIKDNRWYIYGCNTVTNMVE